MYQHPVSMRAQVQERQNRYQAQARVSKMISRRGRIEPDRHVQKRRRVAVQLRRA